MNNYEASIKDPSNQHIASSITLPIDSLFQRALWFVTGAILLLAGDISFASGD
jgi:hypothetical protein